MGFAGALAALNSRAHSGASSAPAAACSKNRAPSFGLPRLKGKGSLTEVPGPCRLGPVSRSSSGGNLCRSMRSRKAERLHDAYPLRGYKGPETPYGPRPACSSPSSSGEPDRDRRRNHGREECSTRFPRGLFGVTYVATRFPRGRRVRRCEGTSLPCRRGFPEVPKRRTGATWFASGRRVPRPWGAELRWDPPTFGSEARGGDKRSLKHREHLVGRRTT